MTKLPPEKSWILDIYSVVTLQVRKNSHNKQTHAAGKDVIIRKYYQSPYPLIKFMPLLEVREILDQKTGKM